MFKKITIEYVKSYFKEQKCECLATDYNNAKTLMPYICNCGNISNISFDNFKQGCRCKSCGNKKCGESSRHKLEYVKSYFKKQECELLTTEYKNGKTLMPYICNCGNISNISFNSFQQGHRCAKCGGKEKHKFEYIKSYFRKQECELLATEYKIIKF